MESDGWRSESLQVFNVLLHQNALPKNQDGEVQGFELMSIDGVIHSIGGGEWTVDAACALALGALLSSKSVTL